MVSTQYSCELSTSSRFVDVIDKQANGLGKDNALLKYFSESGEVESITFDQYRYAVYGAGSSFKDLITNGLSINEQHGYLPVGYLSNSDKDCVINHMGLIYINATPVILSPRNSVDILVHLLTKSGSKVLVYDDSCKDKAEKCQELIPNLKLIKKFRISSDSFKRINAPEPVIKYQGPEHTIAVIHSSGSTSYPKLILLSNRYALETCKRASSLSFENQCVTKTVLALCPLFHVFGLSLFWRTIYRAATFATSRSSSTLSPAKMLQDANLLNATTMVLLPFQIKQIVEYCLEDSSEERWSLLKNINTFHYGGASLPTEVSDVLLAKGVNLLNGYGSTETGVNAVSLCTSPGQNPKILTLYPNVKFDIVNRVGEVCQMMIKKSDLTLATGLCKPDDEGFILGDRIKIVNHDESSKLFQFEVLGRVDDTIIHISGEKSNPVPMEEIILTSPLVDKCVILGSGRINNCLLVQFNPQEALSTPILDVLKEVYKRVDKANNEAPSHSRIDHELIYFLPIDTKKLLPTTAKGNVIRSKAEKVFEKEISATYNSFEVTETHEFSNKTNNDSVDINTISQNIESSFNKVIGKPLIKNTSFFSQGMDSLSAVKFNNILKSLYPKSKVSVNVIYETEKFNSLAQYILDKYKGKEIQSRTLESYQKEVDDLIKEYSQYPDLTIESPKPKIKKSKLNVLITGANGSLGSFIIRSLLQREDIGYIYGLARASNNDEAMKKIKAGFSDRKINLSESQWSQVKGFAYVTDDAQLGLNKEDYNNIFNSVDIIYHVAWRMDFLKGVLAFTDCIESTVNLLKISALSPNHPAFHFTSTVGATFPVNPRLVVEEVKLTPNLVNIGACNGYNLSKLVSEILCYRWADHFGFPLDVHRVGQVSGDTINGVWNVREHVSLLIKAAQVMGMIPESFMDSVSWIPVDVAANAMVEINFDANNPHTGTINHIVNPQTTPWKNVITLLQELGIKCEPVTSSGFVETLQSESKFQDVDINPLASLTDFFTNMLNSDKPSNINMETSSTSQRSPSIKSCAAVNGELLGKYLGHWSDIHFIDSSKLEA